MLEITCPECESSEGLSIVETLWGEALFTWYPEEEEMRYDGETKIDWNSQTPDLDEQGRPTLSCRICGHVWTESKLIGKLPL